MRTSRFDLFAAALLTGTALGGLAGTARAQDAAAPAPQGDSAAPATDDLEEIVVTGITSKNRKLITASADITFANEADILRKAPKSTAELLEVVPGIFVEGTAGAISNNYSVRGLQGGGQAFVQLEEDGMPVLYSGGGADRFFQNDITIERLEAVRGGSSGILSTNGAAATINFISRMPNHDEFVGLARASAENYGKYRGEFYATGPITDALAFNVGGYVGVDPGVRDNPYDYRQYNVKGALEYKFPDGGLVRLSGRIGDRKDAYYAPQPFQSKSNGDPGDVPGFDTQFGNYGGNAFGSIDVPVSTFVEPDGFRTFRFSEGVRSKTKQIRLDLEKPVTDSVDLFVRTRYLDYKWDFNGIFPGGNSSLTAATNYLTESSVSPIQSLLTSGRAAFPTATRFGIKDLTNGRVIAGNDIASLNALNGNGLLQRSVLNHDVQDGRDYGLNAGGRWEYDGDSFGNSLTAGLMYYSTRYKQNQSATASLVNDVRSDAHIYDIVALDANNAVIGTLSDNGLISYGDWGAGIRKYKTESVSLYANDELRIGEKLRIDGGFRYEHISATQLDGNALANSQPVPTGTSGILTTVGSAWDGTYSRTKKSYGKTAWTIGANYLVTNNLSVYGRYADGFQTNGVNRPTDVILYEAGVRYQGHGLVASATVFRTEFDKQFYETIRPTDQTQRDRFQADLRTNGIEFDLNYRPVDFFTLDFVGVFQKPKFTGATINGVGAPEYSGNRPERTPKTLLTITPTFKLPNDLGEVYGRYKYVGNIFADPGNGIKLPSYGVTSAGISLNINEKLTAEFHADNIFNVVGLTEGNPRDGQVQAVGTSGYFFGRGIYGTTYGGSVTFKF